MPPKEKKEWNGMNGGKIQGLERARLQQMLEWSCWKTNNEKDKLDVDFGRTKQTTLRRLELILRNDEMIGSP